VKQPGGKTVYAWAVEGDVDAGTIRSNTFSMEWPRGSAKTKSFPEIDRADWFDLDTAKVKILIGQLGLLEQLSRKLSQPNR
jgi:predicted NUDIX family NTP pyrophosphohydrolase